MTEEEDAEARADEVVALASLYPETFTEGRDGQPHEVVVRADGQEEGGVRFRFTLPSTYPSSSPPELGGPWLPRAALARLRAAAEELWREGGGAPSMFATVEWARENMAVASPLEAAEEDDENEEERAVADEAEARERARVLEGVAAGEWVVDRKSRFVGHAARASTLAEVNAVRAALLRDRRTAGATHNIAAWVLRAGEKNYDDDGESGAGKRMLALLARMGADDVVVVVTRWYGGVHLGPPRFKHINYAAATAVKAVATNGDQG